MKLTVQGGSNPKQRLNFYRWPSNWTWGESILFIPQPSSVFAIIIFFIGGVDALVIQVLAQALSLMLVAAAAVVAGLVFAFVVVEDFLETEPVLAIVVLLHLDFVQFVV